MRTINVGGNQGRGNPPAKTGWPAPELAQDDHRPLFRWFASKPDARLQVREAAARIHGLRTEDGGEQVDTDRPSMLASRWFWASAVVCACLWSAVAFLK